MADRIIASGDAHPLPTADAPREFLSSGETFCRLSCAPEIAARHFNDAAPDASLLALAIASAVGSIGVTNLVLEQQLLPRHMAEALEMARGGAEEVLLVLHELQRRDGLQYAGDDQ